MDAVAIELGGEIGPVVHDKGDAALLDDRLQPRRRGADRLVVDILEAELHRRHVAAGERRFQQRRELVRIERRRRDQVETGCCLGLRAARSVSSLINLDDLVKHIECYAFTVDARCISSIDWVSAASNSVSLIETRRSWTSAREKLAIMP